MERINAGYRIVEAVRLDNCNEIVIGEAVSKTRPAQYVCWDCTDGDNYNNGGYCDTYRQALNVLSERITRRYDFLPLRAPEDKVPSRRAKLFADLVMRKLEEDLEDECPTSIKEAGTLFAETVFCDVKFDPVLFFQWFKENGWVREDLEYFGITEWFDMNNEEGDTADDYLC